uniref:Agnestins biosynthesis cluster transcription factor AgnL10 n=1 Tax=Paecilomyces divaricatus TaxID=644132 RepID=AGN10_PAEDI|nr:RecName: Full=Agnestins biosynthesis cluster transcription factor AgnL10; AltName: Full=Agnestins biosynthesis cluster protein L10 [Paecilomyces divaricatus]QBG38878.1 transcription factor [Paecilomyces divaricatus]
MQFPLASAHEDSPPAGLKLRDSCNRCAVSKIKCSKEKPACARCAKQDKVCEYSATKRAGRKRGSRRHNNPVPSPTTQDLPTAAPSTCPTFLEDPETIPLSPRPPFESYPDLFPGIFSIGDDPLIATPITLDTFSFPFDSFSASPISLPTLDVSDGDHLPDAVPLNHLNHPGDRTDVARATALLASDHASASSMDPAAGPQRPPDEPSSGPICGFIRALGLLNGLSSPAWPTSHHPGLDPRPSSRSIMAENEQTVRAISEMLHCQCFDDGYLLAILSMLILKVLSSYATLLRQTPGPDGDGVSWDNSTPPPGEQGAGVDGEDHCRTIAQQILGQLHRVQRLVSILSQRFNIPGGRARTPDSTAGPDLLSSIETLFPVPGSMLEQMEGLLRKRLRTLSAEIVDILR